MKNLFYLLSIIVTLTAFGQNEPEKQPSQEKKKPQIEKKENRPHRNGRKPCNRKHPKPPQKPKAHK